MIIVADNSKQTNPPNDFFLIRGGLLLRGGDYMIYIYIYIYIYVYSMHRPSSLRCVLTPDRWFRFSSSLLLPSWLYHSNLIGKSHRLESAGSVSLPSCCVEFQVCLRGSAFVSARMCLHSWRFEPIILHYSLLTYTLLYYTALFYYIRY